MIHRQTFFENLQLPEDHPEYPNPLILHTMCATGGFFLRSSRPEPSEFGDEHLAHAMRIRERAMAQASHLGCYGDTIDRNAGY